MSGPEQPSKAANDRDESAYALEPDATPLELPGQVVMKRDEEDLHFALGTDLMLHAHNCVRQFGDFHLALSGGSTPMPFYMRLMVDPAFRSLPWRKTHLWLVDERRVPEDDEQSNYQHIRDYIVAHSGMPIEQAHPMQAMSDDADVRYERELESTLSWRERGHDRLDFILLGMGADGHTASLFPRSPALAREDRWVVLNTGPNVTPPDRVTMTYRLINASRFIGVLVTGQSKRAMLERVSRRDGREDEVPILGVQPSAGVMRWYVDEAAGAAAEG